MNLVALPDRDGRKLYVDPDAVLAVAEKPNGTLLYIPGHMLPVDLPVEEVIAPLMRSSRRSGRRPTTEPYPEEEGK
jgi:hypothetical protein